MEFMRGHGQQMMLTERMPAVGRASGRNSWMRPGRSFAPTRAFAAPITDPAAQPQTASGRKARHSPLIMVEAKGSDDDDCNVGQCPSLRQRWKRPSGHLVDVGKALQSLRDTKRLPKLSLQICASSLSHSGNPARENCSEDIEAENGFF